MANPGTVSRLTTSELLPDGHSPVPLGSGVVAGILGTGGMSVVYRIWNEQLGVFRAVKMVRSLERPDVIERFRVEMAVSAQLEHPNIVRMHSVGEWNGFPFIEMELLQGVGLKTLIENHGPLSQSVVCAIGFMLCASLDYLHSKSFRLNGIETAGIIYRDLKPANVIIAPDGQVKLMDLGTAIPAELAVSRDTGTFVGSLAYCAPEFLDGARGDARSDLYSLAIVIYEMLCGEKTFAQASVDELMVYRRRNAYKPLARRVAGVATGLAHAIEKCLSTDNRKRIQSPRHLGEILDRIGKMLASDTPQERLRRYINNPDAFFDIIHKRRQLTARRVLGGVLAGCSIVAVLIAGWWVLQRSDYSKATVVVPAAPADTVVEIGQAATRLESVPASREQSIGPTRRSTIGGEKAPVAAPVAIPLLTWTQFLLGMSGPDGYTELRALANSNPDQNVLLLISGELHKGQYGAAVRLLNAIDKGSGGGGPAELKPYFAHASECRRLVSNFFDGADQRDPQFFLAKGYLAFHRRDFAASAAALETAHALIDRGTTPREVIRTITYYRAVSYLHLIKSSGGGLESAQKARSAWKSVITEFDGAQDLRYASAARDQLKRLAIEEPAISPR